MWFDWYERIIVVFVTVWWRSTENSTLFIRVSSIDVLSAYFCRLANAGKYASREGNILQSWEWRSAHDDHLNKIKSNIELPNLSQSVGTIWEIVRHRGLQRRWKFQTRVFGIKMIIFSEKKDSV